MLTASEANYKTQYIIDNYKKDLLLIENKINDAILRGRFSISGTEYLSDLVLKHLNNLGYKITLNNGSIDELKTSLLDLSTSEETFQLNNPYYQIEWS